MRHWRKFVAAGVSAFSLVGVGTLSAAAEPRDTLIEFDSMTPIGTGAPTERELPGGGLPWVITSGTGTVNRQGDVHVTVKGLLLAAGPKIGTNPFPQFEAVLSCLTPAGVMNSMTPGAATDTPGGDATIDATIAVPRPCKSPEVFVGALVGGSFHWFAVSNMEEDQD